MISTLSLSLAKMEEAIAWRLYAESCREVSTHSDQRKQSLHARNAGESERLSYSS